MVEISEKERNRRRVQRDADSSIPAQSFRFGADVREKLLKVARRRDRSQADVMRDLIDLEYERLFDKNSYQEKLKDAYMEVFRIRV